MQRFFGCQNYKFKSLKEIFSQKKIKEIEVQLLKSSDIAIIVHLSPDGDAMGSAMAMRLFLLQLNLNVTVITPDRYPEYLHWLPGNESVKIFSRNKIQVQEIVEKSDTIFCLDFNDSKRCGDIQPFLEKSTATKIMIDHHPEPVDFATYCFSSVEACSTAELVYLFIKQFENPKLINKDIASCVYVGIMTDTANYSHNSSNPETFKIVAELLELGIDKDGIFDKIYNNFSVDRMRLMGFCLNTQMKVVQHLHTAYFGLTLEHQKEYNHVNGDTEGFVNMPLSITGILFSAFFMEKDDHIKISFRSKGNFDVNIFARKHFNGGGHRNASGGKSFVSYNQTLADFENILNDYQNELSKL